MNGLATYKIIKTGFGLGLIVLLLCIAIYFTINSIKKNYLSTTICNIKSIPNSNYEQKLTYSVNGQNYEYTIYGVTTTNKNITTTKYAYPEGNCTIYYPKSNPNEYSINYNPTTVSAIFAGVLFVIAILMTLYLLFLRSNKEFAGYMGGVDIIR
jgi:hypothetical protein